MYLKELRNFKPSPSTATDSTLTEKFSTPTPPPKPSVVAAPSAAAESSTQAMEEADWPAYVDPIDTPGEYEDMWDFTTETNYNLERKEPMDYTHGHH